MDYLLLPYFIISAFVALLDIVPLLVRHMPWRYSCSQFLQIVTAGMVIFIIDLPTVPWWGQGIIIAVWMTLPVIILPAARGAYVWYKALLNSVVVGAVFSLTDHFLPDIARSFSTAA